MELQEGKKIYFASDMHLGHPNADESREREKDIVQWFESIREDAQTLYLVGDIFDFWYEYKWVIPRGYVRFLGKLAEMSDQGIDIHFFTGNHDIWIKNYLPQEINVTVHKDPLTITIAKKKFFIHHGHALGKYDKGMNFLNAIFENKFLQWCFSRIHPNGAFGFAHGWSGHNRKAKVYESSNYMGEEKEWLILFSKDILKKQHYDYFIFGHRHVAMTMDLKEKQSKYINLGNWITNSTYAVFDGQTLQLKQFNPNKKGTDSILHL